MALDHNTRQVYTLRLWRERLGVGQYEWRGELVDLRSGERRYFRDQDSLVTHLRAILPPLGGKGEREVA